MPRHQTPTPTLPSWVTASEGCIRWVAEDLFRARAMALPHKPGEYKPCRQILTSAEKAMRIVEDVKAGEEARVKAGLRATRKYWEAKSCARREGNRKAR